MTPPTSTTKRYRFHCEHCKFRTNNDWYLYNHKKKHYVEIPFYTSGDKGKRTE